MLVCQKAPDFRASAVLANGDIHNEFRLHDHIDGKYGLLFFYPLNFTFVCPTELIALDKRVAELKKLNVEPMAISIDSAFTHQAWRNTPIEKGGIGQVQYPLIADIKHEIAQAYGVEHPELGIALRGTFLIDKSGVVRSQIVNDAPIGRNIDEIIRLFHAIQFHEEHGEVCPAGWQKGHKAMKASAEGVAKYLSESADDL